MVKGDVRSLENVLGPGKGCQFAERLMIVLSPWEGLTDKGRSVGWIREDGTRCVPVFTRSEQVCLSVCHISCVSVRSCMGGGK